MCIRDRVKNVLTKVPGIKEITVVRELGQPSLVITPDRAKLARFGLNVSDVNTLVGTAIGGSAATQVIPVSYTHLVPSWTRTRAPRPFAS